MYYFDNIARRVGAPSQSHAKRWAFRRLLLLSVCTFFACWGATEAVAANQCDAPTFNVAPSYGAGTYPYSVAAGDFNGDGIQDLAVANLTSNDVSILIGDGAGAFAPPLSVQLGVTARSIATGDFNGDGKLDLVVATGFNPREVIVLTGDGAGHFAPSLTLNTNVTAYDVVVGDFNGDGKKDLAVAGYDWKAVLFLLGDGAGHFAPATQVAVGAQVTSVAVGDFNNDGLSDVAFTGSSFNWMVGVIPGKASGQFAVGQTIPMNGNPVKVAVGDFNGDGKQDFVASYSWTTPGYGVSIFLNNGAGSFGAPKDYFTGPEPVGLAVGDLNGDGRADVVTTVSSSQAVAALLSDSAGNLSDPSYFVTNFGPVAVALADYDGDGKADAAVVNSGSNNVSVLRGNGAGALDSSWTVLNGGSRIASADFNRDGRTDVVVVNSTDAEVFLNNGAGGFAPSRQGYRAATNLADVAVADFNSDGRPDLALTSYYRNTLFIALGNGAGDFSPPSTVTLPATPRWVTVGDFNADGKPDLVITYDQTFQAANKLSVLLGDGAGGFTFSPALPYAGGAVSAVVAGDLNGDGRDDLAVAADKLYVLLGDGTGGFTPAPYSPLATDGAPSSVAVGDVNKDGRNDLVTANGSTNVLSVLLARPSGGFADANSVRLGSPPVPDLPPGLLLADFNSDGNLDLAVRFTPVASRTSSGIGNLALLEGDGAGGFGTPSYLVTGAAPTGFVAGQFDADAKIDLVTIGTSIWPPILTLLRNTSSPKPCLSVDDVTVNEGDAAAVEARFTVSLSEPSQQTVSVNYSVVGLTATAGQDFTPASGRLSFPPGVTTRQIAVPVSGDLIDEFDEAFNVVLSEPAGAALARPAGTGTIIDNDPEPSVSVNDATITESYNLVKLTLTLSAVSGKPITVSYSTADGTASATQGDYRAASGQVTIPPGSKSADIYINCLDDSMYEPDEDFFVNLSSPVNATLARAQSRVTILNNDPVPSIYAEPVSLYEGDSGTTEFNVRVSLSNPSYLPVGVDYATSDGSAVAGDDYAATSGRLTFDPGETTKTITILVNGDTTPELNEWFLLALSGATNATVTTDKTYLNILNDDAAPPGTVVISEFRFRGSAGAYDEFVEFYNTTDSPVFVSTTDGSSGWALRTSANITRFVIPVGTIIPARGHLLAVNANTLNPSYSLGSYAAGDIRYTADIPDGAGVALFRSSLSTGYTPANIMDAVGFATTALPYVEGRALTSPGAIDGEYGWVRRITNGRPQDTNDNASDFILVSTTGPVGGVPAALGAPGPQNLLSPRTLTGAMGGGPIAPKCGLAGDPGDWCQNMVRDAADVGANKTYGTLSIRRRFVNNTGAPITRLRFRITGLSSGTGFKGAGDLRALDSDDITVRTGYGELLVMGSKLETPPAQSSGGGLNSSLAVPAVSLETPLAPGASINVQFLFGVERVGNYKLSVSAEWLP